jgi:hypothetical protein
MQSSCIWLKLKPLLLRVKQDSLILLKSEHWLLREFFTSLENLYRVYYFYYWRELQNLDSFIQDLKKTNRKPGVHFYKISYLRLYFDNFLSRIWGAALGLNQTTNFKQGVYNLNIRFFDSAPKEQGCVKFSVSLVSVEEHHFNKYTRT